MPTNTLTLTRPARGTPPLVKLIEALQRFQDANQQETDIINSELHQVQQVLKTGNQLLSTSEPYAKSANELPDAAPLANRRSAISRY